MSLFSLFRRTSAGQLPKIRRMRPGLESFEDRWLPSGLTISGYVFDDANNNGLFDAGEKPLGGSNLNLRNSTGTVVATGVSNTNGYYEFNSDNSINPAPLTRTVLVTFDNSKTGWTKTGQVAKFDPSLGQLTSVEIINTATMNTEMLFENLDEEEGTITGTVNGTVTLSASGINPLTAQVSKTETFQGLPFDGEADFSGTSGFDSGITTSSNSQSVTLTSPADLALFTGSGSIPISVRARATSTTSGPGNLLSLVNTSAGAEIKVIYHYGPDNSLKPGNYFIVQTTEPAGYLDGKESSGGVVLPTPSGADTIPVSLGTTNSTHNDFGEIKPASVSGYVYVDMNDNGVRDEGEPPLSGILIGMTGITDQGSIGPIVTYTDANGFYRFDNLRPGSYTISEGSTPNYNQGRINAPGSLGGQAGRDYYVVPVKMGDQGVNYNFGELLPPTPPHVVPDTPTNDTPRWGKYYLLWSPLLGWYT